MASDRTISHKCKVLFEPNDLDFGYIVKPYKEIEDPTIKIY